MEEEIEKAYIEFETKAKEIVDINCKRFPKELDIYLNNICLKIQKSEGYIPNNKMERIQALFPFKPSLQSLKTRFKNSQTDPIAQQYHKILQKTVKLLKNKIQEQFPINGNTATIVASTTINGIININDDNEKKEFKWDTESEEYVFIIIHAKIGIIQRQSENKKENNSDSEKMKFIKKVQIIIK